jgi:hypothetical protein
MYANRSSHQPEMMRSEVRTGVPAQGAAGSSLLATVVRNAAVYEWLVAFYLVWLCLLAFFSTGPFRHWCMTWTSTSLAIHLSTVTAVRGGLIGNTFLRGFATRIVSYGAFQYSYFGLRYLLPAAVPWSLDQQLYEFDLKVFHYEPSLAWDRFVSSGTTEWFAFFYFLYFLIVAGHVFPILFGAKNDEFLSEFAMGILTLFCVGHALYFVVPAYGPFKHLASEYAHALPNGTFMDLVNRSVAAGGAQKTCSPRTTPRRRCSSRSSRIAIAIGCRSSTRGRSSRSRASTSLSRRCSCAGTTWSTSSPASRSRASRSSSA